ncbi:hypothetical protein CR513_31528, partial [Mucuna pruriens]
RMSQAKKKEADITWQHCESVPLNRLQVKCKYCSHACWSGIARMKHHFAGTKIMLMLVQVFQMIQKQEENSLDCLELEEVAKEKEGASKVVREYGKGLKPPTYHEVRVFFSEKAVDNIHKV